jgi:hypothetical protein
MESNRIERLKIALGHAEEAEKICLALKSSGSLGCSVDDDPETALQAVIRHLKKLIRN